MTWQEFVTKLEKGEVTVGVDPALAKGLFTDTNHTIMKEKIGERLSVERFFAITCWLFEFITLAAGMIASIFALKWYSLMAIPGMLIGYFTLGSKASMDRQRMGAAVALLITSFLLAYYFKDRGIYMIIWLVLLPLPYFFARLTYKLVTTFFRSLAIRNEKAFDLLYNRGIFVKDS